MPKLRSAAQSESKKHPYLFFFYFWFKNKQVWTEKIGKKTKKFQKLKSCRQLPAHLIHTSFSNISPGESKKSTFTPTIFSNCLGSEVVGSSFYQKNIGAYFTHLHIPSLFKEFFVMRHNIGHSSCQGWTVK